MATNADAQIKVTANTSGAREELDLLTKSVKEVNKAVSQLRGYSGKDGLTKSLNNIKDFMSDYEKLREQITKGGEELSSITRIINDQSVALKGLAAQQEKLNKAQGNGYKSQYKDIDDLIKKETELHDIYNKKVTLYKASDKVFDQAIVKYEKSLVAREQYANALAAREQVMTNGFLKRIQNSAAYIAGYAIFDTLSTGLGEGLNAISQFEQGITDLRRTLDKDGMSNTSFEGLLSNFGKAAIDQAKDFGVAIAEVQDAMTELSRAGVKAGDLKGMSESVLMGLNTTELESAEEVTSALVSTIKQMNMEWSDSGMILDSWNFLADNYAVKTDDFAHAIERSGAASKMLGMDLYDLNAVVTILGESTQASGEQVGTAFRSLSARLLRDSTIEKLESYGIQVKKDADTFLDFQTIMENINNVIKDLPDDSQVLSDIMDTLGGAWRKNWITALTQDFDRFDDLVKEQAENVGYSAEENAKAMDTISKKAEILKQTFLEAFIDIGEEGGVTQGIKDMLDGTTKALESAINSPTLRTVLDFLFGNPTEAIGLTILLSGFKKLNKEVGLFQTLSSFVMDKVPNQKDTFGKTVHDKYNKIDSMFGHNGKQKRATDLYDKMKKDYRLTHTEMLPIAERIDEIFNSNTKSIATTKSEMEKYSASVKDAKKSLKHFLSEAGKKEFIEAIKLTDGRFNDDKNEWVQQMQLRAYEKEVERRTELLVELENQKKRAAKINKVDPKVGKNEGGIFGSLATAKFKEGIRGMVGGLASMGVQMAVIAAAAKGIDYILNRHENAKNNFDEGINQYTQQIEQIRESEKLLTKDSDFATDFNRRARYVGFDKTNKGLSKQEFNSFLGQLEQLKSIAPEVAMAIEQSARQMGNFSGAVDAAKDALLELRNKQALDYFKDNSKKDFQKNMNAWEKDLKKSQNAIHAMGKTGNDFLNKIGVYGKEADGNIVIDDANSFLSNVEDLISHREEIASKLEGTYFENAIEGFFEELSGARLAIESAKSDANDRATMHLDTLSKEMIKDLKNFEMIRSSVRELIGSSQSVSQAEMLHGFVDDLVDNSEALAGYDKLVGKLKNFSKMSAKSVAKMLTEYADEAVEYGLIEEGDKESFLSALFSQQFDVSKQEYDSIVKNAETHAKNAAIDISKAFGAQSFEEMNANSFIDAGRLANQLDYYLNDTSGQVGEKVKSVAKSFVDALNSGIFQGSNFGELDLSNFLKLNTDSANTILSTLSAIKEQSNDLGKTLYNSFDGDLSRAFNSLAVVAKEGAAGFSDAMLQITEGMDLSQTANLLNEMAALFNIGLNDDILVNFDLELDESSGTIQEKIDEATTGKTEPTISVKLKTKTEPSELEQQGQEGKESYNNGFENGEPTPAPQVQGNPEEAKKQGEKDKNAYNQGVENTPPPKATAPEADTSSAQEAGDKMGKAASEATEKNYKPNFDIDGVDLQKSLVKDKPEYTVEVKLDATEAENKINSLKDKHPKITFKPVMDDVKSKLEEYAEDQHVDIELHVNADLTDLRSDVDKITKHATADITVNAETGDAIKAINNLEDISPTIRLKPDVQSVANELSTLIKQHSVDVTVDADVGPAKGTIDSLLTEATGKVNSLGQNIGSIAGKVTNISQQVVTASSSLSTIAQQAESAMGAVSALRTEASTQISFNIDTSTLTPLASNINNTATSVGKALDTMTGKITSAASVFANQCRAITSAWASMSFPTPNVPIIPSPRIAGSGGGGGGRKPSSGGGKAGRAAAPPSGGSFSEGGVVGYTGLANVHGSPNAPEVVFNARDAKKLYDMVRSSDFRRSSSSSDSSFVVANSISDAIERSMTHVLKDAMKDYSDLMKESWEAFSRDYNMSTVNGFYANKIDVPYLELDPEAKDALKQFVNTKIEIKGWDTKNVSYIKQYIMQDSSRFAKLTAEMKKQAEYYDSIGDSIGKANAETEAMILMQKQSNALRQDANELAREMANLEKTKGKDFSQYLDANLELNYLYAKQVDSFGEGNNEAKTAFENNVKAYQELAKALDDTKKTMKELAIEMDKQLHSLATNYLENAINKGYDSQKDYYQGRLDRIERERDQYEKDMEAQREKLEEARKQFDDDIQAKIDKIRNEQEARDDAEKLKRLQEKIKNAEDRLNGLKNEYDTKVYSIDENGEWQFTYQANPEELEEAVENLEEAQQDLKEYYENKEIDRLEKERENYEKQYDQMVDALEKQYKMRQEQYDQEIEALELHLEQVEDMREQALKQLDKLAYQFVERLKTMFRYDLGKVNDYLNTLNGNANIQSYNPLSELVPSKYAQQLAASGVNLEKYTNELLEITRNGGKYDPTIVQNAISELKKLGTTGAIDVGSSIKMNAGLKYAMDQLGANSINDFIFHNLNRIGETRGEAFGDKAGTIVTAQDMANYFKKLGINTSAIQLSNLKDKVAKQELDWKGNPLIGVLDRMEGFGTNINFGESGQGLLNDAAWSDLMGSILGFDGTAKDIYDLTGKLITNSEEDLVLGDNVIMALLGNNKFLEGLQGQNKEYYDKVSQQLTELIEKMDANEFFSKEGMNKHLEYALQGSTDVNKFIIENLQRIGTIRTEGDLAGQAVSATDVFKYFDKLGISGQLVLNTVKSTTGLNYTTDLNNEFLDQNNNILGLSNQYTGSLNKTNLELLSAGLKSIGSQNNLASEIKGLPTDFQKLIMDFAKQIDRIIAGLNKPSKEEIQHNLGAASQGLNAALQQMGQKPNGGTTPSKPPGIAVIPGTNKPADQSLGYAPNGDHYIYKDGKLQIIPAGKKGYSKGGVVDYTGNANVHGAPNAPEVVFNATDAKKLYDLIHNLDLTTMNLPRISAAQLPAVTAGATTTNHDESVTIQNLTMEFPQVNDPDGVKKAILDLSRNIKLYT